ncbi:CRP/FNR family transcriptional regulator, anaerobic regulatory protein [Marinitoga hydrogenitolerans DSM 16785]|uniref:CRP/FNR family transcriptional regulator, anaerobic regulatory protein n=1 Tax=Marinitoga hydrogenitolerans (strain DSM 16785 / JCM 12826 / AT1271) TaxID=1122195 RepID=A0A1M4USH0_MARH1|nr:Crp/Fnr family transcriptional regulator [Marinitoga hydrogenitolerans]SHE59666.1 CRP/FNR family transcriptional regulator, anaerobic regulatory protein [Marinitoga hydrogenitolerans DSM 16785]
MNSLIIKEIMSLKKQLKNYSKISIAKKNEILHSPHEKLEQMSIVIEGKLKVVKFTSEGNEQVLKYVNENESFGEGLIFADECYPSFIIAEKKSKVLEISKEGILYLFKKNEDFLVMYLNEISKKMINLSNVIDILIIKSIKERIIKYFILLSKQQKSKIVYFKSKQKIANDIGSVREVVSKKIKELEKEGILKIIDKHHVKILKEKLLE